MARPPSDEVLTTPPRCFSTSQNGSAASALPLPDDMISQAQVWTISSPSRGPKSHCTLLDTWLCGPRRCIGEALVRHTRESAAVEEIVLLPKLVPSLVGRLVGERDLVRIDLQLLFLFFLLPHISLLLGDHLDDPLHVGPLDPSLVLAVLVGQDAYGHARRNRPIRRLRHWCFK